MVSATSWIGGVASGLLFALPGSAQVLNPSQITLLPPQQSRLGVYFASSQPTAYETLAGADVFTRGEGLHRLTTVADKSDSITGFAISDDGSLLAYTTAKESSISILHTDSGQVDLLPFQSPCFGLG